MHFDQENGLKPHFGPFLALNGPFLGQNMVIMTSYGRHDPLKAFQVLTFKIFIDIGQLLW